MIKFLFKKVHNIHYRYLDIKSYYYRNILLSCGHNLKIWGSCYIKNPSKIKVGNNVSINDGCYINGLGGIEIGDNVSISACSIIVSTMLDADSLKNHKKHINKKIKLGNNIQIGAGAIVLGGVTIGNNVIVGAGAVVTKDIQDNCIVVGNPAKVLRSLA